MLKTVNDCKFIDKTYPAGTEVEVVTIDEWTAGKGKEPSANMRSIVEAGEAYCIKFDDGTFRFLMPSNLE